MRKILLVGQSLLCLLSFQLPAFSMLIADIDIVEFPITVERRNIKLLNEERQHPYHKNNTQTIPFNRYLRIALFDQQVQEFTDTCLHYLPLSEQLSPVSLAFPGLFTISYVPQPQQITLSLLPADMSPFAHTKVIRCNTPILQVLPNPSHPSLNLEQLEIWDETRPSLRVWHMPGQIMFPQQLTLDSLNQFLNSFSETKKMRNKSLATQFYFCELHNTLGPVCETYTINFQQKDKAKALKNEKGRIGELAADMTMQCFGFYKRDGKYGGGRDNGFDGIYCRNDALFISDSKFFAIAPNLLSVLHKDIYATIEARLANIEYQGLPQAKQTAAYVRSFMVTNPHNVFLLPYVVLPDGKIKALVRPFRTVHTALDPTRRTAMLEMLFGNLTITPPNATGFQAVQITQPLQPQENLQITHRDAYQCMQFLMQRLGMHTDYRLIKHEDAWQPITPESLRNPQVKLLQGDLTYFEALAQLCTPEQRNDVERVMGEIADPMHQIQVLKHLHIILGKENEKVKKINIGKNLSWLIRNLSTSLKPNNYIQAEKLANKIFDVAYKPILGGPFFDLTLESHMVMFETFLSSPHFYEEKLWDTYHSLYYLIHGGLCCIEIDPEETAPHLSDFVETLKNHPINDLVNIIQLGNKLYNRPCYADLKGIHDCEDWMLLTQTFLPLPPDHRRMIVSFMKKFPPSFSCGPADAIECCKPLIPLIDNLEERELFDSTDVLINQAFSMYDNPIDQIFCLELIMQGVIEEKNQEEILQNLRKKIDR